MSLKKLAAAAKTAGDARREITVKLPDGGEDVSQFREAQPPDFYPSTERVNRLRLKFPRLRGLLLLQVVILGSCYLQPEEERGEIPDLMFAKIACNDLTLWQAIVTAHKKAFPDCPIHLSGAGEDDENPFGPSGSESGSPA